MKWVVLVLVILSVGGCTWSKNHQIMMGTYVTAHAVDIMQTREIISNENYYELNPVLKNLSPNQATITMIGSTGVVYLLAETFPVYRTWIIGIPMTLALVCMFHNWKIGVTF